MRRPGTTKLTEHQEDWRGLVPCCSNGGVWLAASESPGNSVLCVKNYVFIGQSGVESLFVALGVSEKLGIYLGAK